MPSPKHAKLILFKKQPPEEAEVLYVMRHTGHGQMPAKYRDHAPNRLDEVWAWILDRRMRKGLITKDCQKAHKKWSSGHYYRPPRGGRATPVRIFGGKKWKWYWMYEEV